MLLQNTLDLSTFEIVRFRIWNQTSNPNDYGIGTKYFNTNSGHEGYNRENIYTATGWRRAAYMDDIDKINEKLDLIFGEELDTDTIIDSWKEVQDFLSGIEDTKNLMTMLDGKLDTKGGTMNGILTMNHVNGTDKASYIIFKSSRINYSQFADYIVRVSDSNGSWYGGFGLRGDTNGIDYYFLGKNGSASENNLRVYSDRAAWGSNTLLHSGNFSNYAVKYDDGASIDAARHSIGYDNGTHGSENLKAKGGYISFGHDSYGGQLLGQPNGLALYYRGVENNAFSAWKTIAFTDSTVEAANKLADDTAYTVWGRTFFENGKPKNVSSSPIFNNNSGLYFKNAAGDANKLLFYFDTAEQLHIGRDSATDKKSTHIYGNPTYFKSSNTGQPLVTITEEGNVLVGAGGLNVAGNIVGQLLRLGNETSAGTIFLDRPSANYIWASKAGGAIHMGVQDTGGTSSSNATLSIHNGYIKSGDRNNAVSLGTSSYRWSNVYSVGGDFSGRVLIGGAEDDGNYKLQVFGGIKAYSPEGHASRLTNGNVSLSLKGSTTGGVAKGLFFNFDGTYVGGLVALHSKGAFQYLYLGDDNTPKWFTINSAESNFNVLTKFNAGALIPTGQSLTIGSVTIKEVATGEIEVNGNLHTTGTLASGGKAAEGENTTGNAMVYQYDLASGESVYTVDNVKGSTNVIVQIFEWNGNTSSWDMILTDVSVKADAITVTFGRTTTVNHMVTVC